MSVNIIEACPVDRYVVKEESCFLPEGIKTKETMKDLSEPLQINSSQNQEPIELPEKDEISSLKEKDLKDVVRQSVSNMCRKRKTTETEDGIILENDDVFAWDEYIEETGSCPVPPTAFLHVENSLESGIKSNMVLEVRNREKENAYWQATVMMICGPLLTLRYLGYKEKRSADFWLDITTSDVKPLGWAQKNKMEIYPPEEIVKVNQEWSTLLNHNLEPVPEYLLEGSGNVPIDQIKLGMFVEIEEELNPLQFWPARVIENVGGRLLLRYFGEETNSNDFWLFYLSNRVHSSGWSNENSLNISLPAVLRKDLPENGCELTIEKALELHSTSKTISPNLLLPQDIIEPHSFKEGMKLEALHPITKYHLCPATVSRVFSSYYFLVEIDDFQKENKSPAFLCCHSASQVIFPINWGRKNGIKIRFPRGYLENPGNRDFDWEAYLICNNASPAPSELFTESYMNCGFEVNGKLEVVNPFCPEQVCAATVYLIVEPLLWIQLDSSDPGGYHHITTLNSQDIFPVGWCESNGYPLKPPRHTYSKRQRKLLKRLSISDQDEKSIINLGQDNHAHMKENSKSWCPKIFFNHKCFSGPFLNKSRLAQLPQHIGPGPVDLVMKEVLSLIINVAYTSCRVLKELQLRGKPRPCMNQEILKAKWKGKSYRGVVEVITRSEQVDDFCKKICRKLDCCTNLFGSKQIKDTCPEKCHSLSKTKYTHYQVTKKRKNSKKPFGNSDIAAKSPTAKEKKLNDFEENREIDKIDEGGETKENNSKSEGSLTSCSVSPTPEENLSSGSGPTNVEKDNRKRNSLASLVPKSSMVTRGAKIPNFSLEMKKWRQQKTQKLLSNEIGNLSSQSCIPGKKKLGRPPNYLKLEPKSKRGRPKIDQSETNINELTDLKNYEPLSGFKIPELKLKDSGTKNLKGKLQNASPAFKRQYIYKKQKITNGNCSKLINMVTPNQTAITMEEIFSKTIPHIKLDSNPLNWSAEEVSKFVEKTELSELSKIIKDEDIDGQALMMMTLPIAQEFLKLKYQPAIQFCYLVEKVKLAFYTNYVTAIKS